MNLALDKHSAWVQIPNPFQIPVEGMIMSISKGEVIGVPCSIQPGPFPHEHFIQVNAADGPLTGFVDEADIHTKDGEHGLLRAVVLDASKEVVEVHLFGSFFRTAGLAYVPRLGLTPLVA